jgi:hypothetical protein
MIGKVLGLRMIRQLVEEGLGFTTLHVRFEILDFVHKVYLCFWALDFFIFQKPDCLLVLKMMEKL